MSAPAVVEVLKALADQTRKRGGSPSSIEIDCAAQRLEELIAADKECDAALAEKLRVHDEWKRAHDVSTATDADFLPLQAADVRVREAWTRRFVALAAVQGSAA